MSVHQSVEMSFLEYPDKWTIILRTFEMRYLDSVTGLTDSRKIADVKLMIWGWRPKAFCGFWEFGPRFLECVEQRWYYVKTMKLVQEVSHVWPWFPRVTNFLMISLGMNETLFPIFVALHADSNSFKATMVGMIRYDCDDNPRTPRTTPSASHKNMSSYGVLIQLTSQMMKEPKSEDEPGWSAINDSYHR